MKQIAETSDLIFCTEAQVKSWNGKEISQTETHSRASPAPVPELLLPLTLKRKPPPFLPEQGVCGGQTGPLCSDRLRAEAQLKITVSQGCGQRNLLCLNVKDGNQDQHLLDKDIKIEKAKPGK